MANVLSMLKAQAEANRQKALWTLDLLINKPVGIGDHSTGDLYKNAEEALQMLVDAKDQIEMIEKLEADLFKPLDLSRPVHS
jgi:hypothetical protein